jgi:hypothetical protein
MLRLNSVEEEGLYVMIVEKRRVTCTAKDPEVNKYRNVLMMMLMIFIRGIASATYAFCHEHHVHLPFVKRSLVKPGA